MEKFKVGDKVRIINRRGSCWNAAGRMDKYMGKIMTIAKINVPNFVMIEDGGRWSWDESDFAEKITQQPSIHITTNGNTVHAILKDGKNTKRAKAVCAPSDTFDFEVGAKLAFDRLFKLEVEQKPETINLYCVKEYQPGEWLTKGKTYTVESDGKSMKFDDGYRTCDIFDCILGRMKAVPNHLVREVKRAAKVGEWVRVLRWNGGRVTENTIWKVEKIHACGTLCFSDRFVCDSDNYIVLENYKPEPEKPKYYSGKVICVERTDCALTAGRVYEVVNGEFTFDSGFAKQTEATNLDELNKWFRFGKFIEYKGEPTEPEQPKKRRVFSTVKYIEVEGAEDYVDNKIWVDACEGKEVVDRQCGDYGVNDNWTIEI